MKELVFFLFLLPSAAISGQDYYLTPGGDTVSGAVLNYKEWSKNPTEIGFKVTRSGETVTLNPFNCKSVVIGNSDTYISYHGTRVVNVDHITSDIVLRGDKTLQLDTIDVFLLEIYRYKDVVLYKLFDNKRTNFYFSRNSTPEELEYYEYINDANVIVPYAVYKAFLREHLINENRSDFARRIETLTYKESSLIDFLAIVLGDRLHASENMRNKYPTEFFAGAGMSMNAGNIKDDAVADASYSATTFSPCFEIGARLYNQRKFGRAFFQPAINVFTSLPHRFRLKDNSEYSTKAMVVTGHIGFGYFFRKESPVAFYGAMALGMKLVINYNTRYTKGTFTYSTHAKEILNKATIHPELGLVINRSVNIALTGTLPYKLPILSNLSYVYTTSQAGFIIRYIFQVRKK